VRNPLPAGSTAEMRRSHEAEVLRIIAEERRLTKPQLTRLSGLSRPTIDLIIDSLLARRVIVAVGETHGRVGRRAMVFSLDPGAGLGLGFDLGGSKLIGALVDPAGRILHEATEPTAMPAGARTVHQMVGLAEQLRERGGVTREVIRQVSVGTPGVLDAEGQLLMGSNVNDLDGVRLRAELERHLDAPVEIDNDVNMAAVGEYYWGSAVGCANFALVQVGTGIGCGLFVDGRLVRGARGAAGEVAFLPLFGDPHDPEALRDGLLESVVGTKALIRRYRDLSGEPVAAVKEIFTRAAADDPHARAVLASLAEQLGYACAAIAALLDPERIVLAGGIGSNAQLIPQVAASAQRLLPYPVTVVASTLGARSGIVGAGSSAASLLRHSLLRREGHPSADDRS